MNITWNSYADNPDAQRHITWFLASLMAYGQVPAPIVSATVYEDHIDTVLNDGSTPTVSFAKPGGVAGPAPAMGEGADGMVRERSELEQAAITYRRSYLLMQAAPASDYLAARYRCLAARRAFDDAADRAMTKSDVAESEVTS